ncbi:MAG: hypothetical protein MUF78_04935 [Candidatus Edwardsbacteria bacterium]|jgi:hypothetical protein|nr:hypothetical protein [Candidatus Edwardsbacteria bacterium]
MRSVLVSIADPALARQVDGLLSRHDAPVIDVRSAAAEVRLRQGASCCFEAPLPAPLLMVTLLSLGIERRTGQ